MLDTPQLITDDFDYIPSQPTLVAFVETELGPVATDSDGFNELFIPLANSYPGDDIGTQIFQEHVDALSALEDDPTKEPDPTLEGDIGAFGDATVQAAINIDQAVSTNPLVSTPIQPPLDDDLDTQIQGTIVKLQDGESIVELPANWIQVTPDGSVTWQGGEGAPLPVELYLSVDGGDFQLFHADRSGHDRPDWIYRDHYYYFELRSQGNAIAANLLDTHDDDLVPAQDGNAAVQRVIVTQSGSTIVKTKIVIPSATAKQTEATAVLHGNQMLTEDQSRKLAAITSNPNPLAFLNPVAVGSTAALQRTALLTYPVIQGRTDGGGSPIIDLGNGYIMQASNGQIATADGAPLAMGTYTPFDPSTIPAASQP